MNLSSPIESVKSDARKHIELLTGNSETPCHFRLIHDSRRNDPDSPGRNILGSIEALWPDIETAQRDGYGVFIVVNAGGHSDAEIETIRAVFIDGDDRPLPLAHEWHDCLTPPAFIVKRTATRWHAYWPVSDLPVAAFKGVQQRLAAFYGSDPVIHNPSRVMRLAGTLHLKDPTNPQLMTIEPDTLHSWGMSYSEAEVAAGLPTVAMKLAEPRPAAKGVKLDSPDNIRRYVDWLQRCKPAIEGNGGDRHTLDVANKGLDLGCSPPVVLKLMLEHFNERCLPPWDADDLAVKVSNAASYRENAIGCDAVGTSQDEFSGLIEKHGQTVTTDARNGETVAFDALAPLKTEQLDTLLAEPDEPTEWLIDGLVEKGEAVMLAGPGGTHKSRTALHWGLAISEGLPVYGRKVKRAAFVYLSYEDVRKKVKNRVKLMTKRLDCQWGGNTHYLDMTDRAKEFLLHVAAGGDLKPQNLYHQLRSYLAAIEGHKFVVLDSTYNVLKFSGNAKIDDGAVNDAVKFLRQIGRETNSTVMFLWHPSYSGQSRGDASGWSTAWHDAPRAKLSLSRPEKRISGKRELGVTFHLTIEKASDAPPGLAHTLQWDDGLLLPVNPMTLQEACVDVALKAAERGKPIKKTGNLDEQVWDELVKLYGSRPALINVRAALNGAEADRELVYLPGRGHVKAGYFPAGTSKIGDEIFPPATAEFDPERNYRIADDE